MKSFELDDPAGCSKHVEISKYKKTAPITKTIKRKKNASMEFSLLFFISNQQRGARLSL